MQTQQMPSLPLCHNLEYSTLGSGLPSHTNWADLLRKNLIPNCPPDSSPYDTELDGASPSTLASGSSAQYTNISGPEDLSPNLTRDPIPTTHPLARAPHTPTRNTIPLLDQAPPIFAFEDFVPYGAERVTFLEKLIWSSCAEVDSIYGTPSPRESGPTANRPLEHIVHEGLIHGLCNEIVISPLTHQDEASHAPSYPHSADKIPFPLFMAEMLRRMRSSVFLLRTAMRYLSDLEPKIKLAVQRSECGWCRSGVSGCEHEPDQKLFEPIRFSRGRGNAARKQPENASSAGFTSFDPMAPLVDPRKAFLGALILANKFHRDRSVGNKVWASMIGLPLEDVHSAERAVGIALEWKFSRPWVTKERDEHGNWMPASLHPTLAEPLFANNDVEVARYAVKTLRDEGNLPPPLSMDMLMHIEELSPSLEDQDIELDDPTPPAGAIAIDITPTPAGKALPFTSQSDIRIPITRSVTQVQVLTQIESSSTDNTPRKTIALPKSRVQQNMLPRSLLAPTNPLKKNQTAPAHAAEHRPLVANDKIFPGGANLLSKPLLLSQPISRSGAIVITDPNIPAKATKRKAEHQDSGDRRLQKGESGQRIRVQHGPLVQNEPRCDAQQSLPHWHKETTTNNSTSSWNENRLRIASLLNPTPSLDVTINVVPPPLALHTVRDGVATLSSPGSYTEFEETSDLGSSSASTPALRPLSSVGSMAQPMEEAMARYPLWQPHTLVGELDAKLEYLKWARPTGNSHDLLSPGGTIDDVACGNFTGRA